ncbi:MAG: hypothetical protein AAGA48_24250 [Myxococcota bacterium]
MTRLTDVGPLPPTEAVTVVLDAFAALTETHAAGRGRGGLSPTTLVQGPEGLELHWPSDRAELVLRSYTAPELRRPGASPTPSGDVYALSLVLFHLVTAQPPADLHLAAGDSPRWDDLPEPLRSVVADGAHADPKARPSPAALVATLEALQPELETVEVPSQTPSVDAEALRASIPSTHAPSPAPTQNASPMVWTAVALVMVLTALGAFMGPLGGLATLWIAP